MILFHAAGNDRIGIGHLRRCRSLAIELMRTGFDPPVFVYEAPHTLACQFVPSGSELHAVEDRATAMNVRWQVLSRYENEDRILVTDLLDLKSDDSELARQHGFNYLIHLNDSGIFEYQADLFVDGDAFKKEKHCLEGGVKWLCGPRYHIVNPDIVSQRPNSPWEKKQVERVLVSFGGSDPGLQTEAIIEHLPGVQENIHWTIVVGPAFSSERWESFQRFTSSSVRLERSPQNIAALILHHDLTLGLGGLTSYEAMCLGRPVAAVAWSYMSYYVSKLADLDLVENLGKGAGAVKALLELCRNPNRLTGLARKGWKTIDGLGAARVAAAIQRLAKG